MVWTLFTGSFASRISHKKAADLGTNNGVIPILMSYMGGAEHITGAEMQERACRLAEKISKSTD